MTSRYTEFDDFSNYYGDDAGVGTPPSVARTLQEIADNVQHFCNNVSTLDRRNRLINTAQDNTRLRQEIIELVSDTAQLAKIADTSIKKLKPQARSLSQADKFQFDRLLSTFSKSVLAFQTIQQNTTHLEQELLSKARSQSMVSRRTIDSVPEDSRDDAPLTHHDSAFQAQRMAEMEADTAVVEQREREMRQLEHDIVDINDIFRDLGTMVHDQGEVIDNIEANVESTATRVVEGNKQLEKAVRHQRCSRKLKCVIAGVVIGVVIAVIIIAVILIAVLTNVFKNHNNR